MVRKTLKWINGDLKPEKKNRFKHSFITIFDSDGIQMRIPVREG